MRPSLPRKSKRSQLLSFILLGLLLVAASCSQSSSPPGNDGDTCSAPSQSCSGVCTNTAVDATNCGSCGARCVAGQTCQAGQCRVSCTPPQLDCGGLCADLTSNALHCGGCGRFCATGQICQNSACVTGSCPAGQMQCNGACVSTLSDPLNCGTCGTPCLVGQSCQAGVCTTVGGTGGSGGSAGAITGGSAGAMSTGGSAGASTGGSAGAMSTGGSAGASTGGTAGTNPGGAAGMTTGGRGGQGGTTGGAGSAGRGGTGSSVPQSATCPNIVWPTASGSRNLGSGITVAAGQTYDGQMNTIEGSSSLEDCGTGDQDSVDPIIEVANGGTVKNLVMGRRVGDGIHCTGSCTIENVWFPNVCDDAITILGSGTVTIRNSGFKNARDKTIQHNGTATVTIDNVYVETAGKLYRSCGEGCSSSSRRSATLSNIVAIGVDQIAGVSTNDTVTMRNICMHRSFAVCTVYNPGTSDESTTGVNGSDEGPNANCVFAATDTHALLSKVTGIPFTTEKVCGGPNGYKSGSTATACVSGFDKCLKACMPGGYGFKEITCTNNRYAEGTGVVCGMPTESVAAQNLAPARVMAATTEVANNGTCSTQWAIGIDQSNNADYCVCVYKPGYYSNSNWLAWDCQRRWW